MGREEEIRTSRIDDEKASRKDVIVLHFLVSY